MNKKLKLSKTEWNTNSRVDFVLVFIGLTLENDQALPIPMWPNGGLMFQLSLEAIEQGLHRTQWVWRNNRSNPRDQITGFKTTFYMCLGVWRCTRSGCRWTLRPMIRQRDFLNQSGKIVLKFKAHLQLGVRCKICNSPIMHMSCNAQQIVSISPTDGGQYKHEGFDPTFLSSNSEL